MLNRVYQTKFVKDLERASDPRDWLPAQPPSDTRAVGPRSQVCDGADRPAEVGDAADSLDPKPTRQAELRGAGIRGDRGRGAREHRATSSERGRPLDR